jgi:hypothetical protein
VTKLAGGLVLRLFGYSGFRGAGCLRNRQRGRRGFSRDNWGKRLGRFVFHFAMVFNGRSAALFFISSEINPRAEISGSSGVLAHLLKTFKHLPQMIC